jgi:hypothetical protein
MLHQIYIIFVPAGIYIGRTKRLIRRMTEHGVLWDDWAVLETTDSLNVRDAEAKWVRHFEALGCHVLNRMRVFHSNYLSHSDETRQKISKGLAGLEVLRANGRRMGPINGAKRVASGGWAALKTFAHQSIAGRVGGEIASARGQIQKLGHSQGMENIKNGHLARLRTPEHQQAAAHTRWHVRKGIVNPRCSLCTITS